MPNGNPLTTPWGPTEPIPLLEYPRPQMTRPEWVNLNGWWDYAILEKTQAAPQEYTGQIRVPYPVESLLSGVQRPLLPEQRLWYRRSLADCRVGGKRVLLHFGAVDYQCEVWVNEVKVGEHRGGYLPFTFDITSALQDGENELRVAVWDPTDTGMQQRGKQVLQPRGIWYTAVSGIWQTVWLELVPEISIESLKLTPNLEDTSLAVEVRLRGAEGVDGLEVEVLAFSSVLHHGPMGVLREATEITEDTEKTLIVSEKSPNAKTIRLSIPEPHLWCPEDPHLYGLLVKLNWNGQPLDEVESYFAMRQFGLVKDENGYLRFALNGQPLFLYGPLDQGYFPDGLYTPPSEEAMLFDIEYTRKIGCNLIRKHIKVEPLRWYYHCDRLGMIVWQDMPNGGLIDGEVIAFLSLSVGWHRDDAKKLSRFGRADAANREEYRRELQGMVDHLHNAACIAIWTPFNESWGQFQAKEISEWLKAYDPTRLIDHASGWFDQGGGDFQSKHIYFKKLYRPRKDGRAFVISEFGGYSLLLAGHAWDESKKFGYRFYDSPVELTADYLRLLEEEVKPLIAKGLAAAVYTETTDVEIEINGFLTYDRQVEKMDAEVLRKAHRGVIE
jgi:hypothetical protein